MRDQGRDAPPPRVLHSLLRLLASLADTDPRSESALGGALGLPPLVADAPDVAAADAPPIAEAPPPFGVAACHQLLAQAEELKASKQLPELSSMPYEGADSRPHALKPMEQQLSRALTQQLAAAILHEAGAGSRGSVWGVGF